ncbi:MAG: GspE/PulE family protein [Burkholderiaceae bacterium]
MYQRTTPFEELDVDAGPGRYRDAGLDTVPGSLEALQVASGSLLGAPVQSPRELRTLLAQRGVRVLHPESLQALANLAGADCVERLIAQRVAHPLDAPDALRQRSRQPCDAAHLERLCTVLCRVPVIQLDRCEPELRAVESVPHDMAQRLHLMPLLRDEDVLLVALSGPISEEAQQLLRFVVQCPVVCVLADAQEIERSIELHYSSRDENTALERLQLSEAEPGSEQDEQRMWREAEALAQEQPIARLVHSLLVEAVWRHASDIHLRPGPHTFEVLFRIDGTLVSMRRFRRGLLGPVVGRIKILSRMNSAEHRLPQDGRIRLNEGGAGIDMRVSVIPVQYGESVVIRILNATAALRTLDNVGFKDHDKALFTDLLRRSYGIVLVTGPTGSGKTTTLYAALQEVVRQNVNIITVEDPIEYELPGVRQIQANPVIGFSFPQALRHILRHDPDVVLVGEMRDQETARIAIESALTGHLVFSTLHTNDAPSSLVRLIEMGVPPYLVRSAVIGILAQRLVRLNCPHCRAEETVDPLVRRNLGVDERETFWHSVGCEQCHHTGFKGRQAIYELMRMNPALQSKVDDGVPADVYREIAVADGMVGLPTNGVELARTGAVSLAEVYRACM